MTIKDFLIHKKGISREQLAKATRMRSSGGERQTPGKILVDMGAVSRADLSHHVLEYINSTGSHPEQVMEWLNSDGIEDLIKQYGTGNHSQG